MPYILSFTPLANLLPWVETRLKNVEAATEVGIVGLQFKGADFLHHDLSQMGINVSTNEFPEVRTNPRSPKNRDPNF